MVRRRRLHCARSLNGGQRVAVDDLAARLDGVEIHAFAGIGNPDRFFRQLGELGLATTCHPLPDHHRFERSDFDGVPQDCMILMTEKDAVKCTQLEIPNAWYLRVSATLPKEWERRFMTEVSRLVNGSDGGAGSHSGEEDLGVE